MKDWLTILKEEVNKTSIADVSARLGYNNHTTISLVLKGAYPAKTDKVAANVLDTFARITCTHTELDITHAECRKLATSNVPTSSPQAMRHWRACQSCIHKGEKQ
jgi:hypothetical protein